MAAPIAENPATSVDKAPFLDSEAPLPSESSSPSSSLGVFSPIIGAYNSFHERRAALGLSNPGAVDEISKEVDRSVFLRNQAFSGLRGELNKAFSASPLFQISHAFATGSQALSPYTFLALYGTNNLLCQAQLDSDASFSARFNTRLSDRLIFKTSAQIQPQSMNGPGGTQISLEQEYTGEDFTAQLKSINPSILNDGLTGVFIGSYMQSVTRRLALGLEGVCTKPGGGMGVETGMSYAARYKAQDWIASAQLLTQGSLQASFWKRLTEKVETGVDLNLQFAGLSGAGPMMGARKEGSATLGAKYEFSRSVFRAQVDSHGKVACLLEKAVVPPVRITFAGEIDHAKNSAKVGLAVAIEQSPEELMEQQEKMPTASPPF